MIRVAIVLVVLALVAATVGFMGVADQGAWIARIAFVVFVYGAAVSFVLGRRLPT